MKKKKSCTLLNILNTDKGGRLLDNTNGPSTPSLLASLTGKALHRYRRGQGSNTGVQAFFLQLSCVLMILSAFVSSTRSSNI